MTSYADDNEASPSLEAANCAAVATFVGSWEAQRNDVLRLAVPRGCELRNCRHFRGLLGSPAEWRCTQIQPRPRGSLGGCEERVLHHVHLK